MCDKSVKCSICKKPVEFDTLDVEEYIYRNRMVHDFCVHAQSLMIAKPLDVPKFEHEENVDVDKAIAENTIGTAPSGVK
jgi:uncharacterized protein YlaI